MFKFSETATYAMPAHFGGYEGPVPAVTYRDVTSLIITYETAAEALARYIPESFQLTHPLVSIQFAMNRSVDWLGGGAYNLIAVNAPVAYVRDGERIEGQYALVLWENRTAPILTGREQTGMPKVYADIEDLHRLDNHVFTTVGHDGSAFLRLDLHAGTQLNAEALSELNRRQHFLNWFGWRYIPHTGRPGAALSHATLFPQEFVHTEAWHGQGSVRWDAPDPARHPTQAHIIKPLSELPLERYGECLMTHGSIVLRNDLARALP